MIRLAEHLSLPVDVVTQTIAILAKRRAGKSYAMRRLAEQLFKAGQQVVLVDPKGDQWGIRFAADGKSPGLSIVILGGERGDVPLEPGGGEVVAKLVVEERVSVLLDLSLFRKHEVATFMTAFLENLYRLKAREVYRTPMMLVVDEADAIGPQKPQKGEERMLGAAEDIVRRGGQRGIGCVLVTQRSAVLNKNLLTQSQVLVVLRTIAPQDMDAMNAWIEVHGTDAQRRTLMDSLPSLPVGDAWFWSPGWPTADGIFKRVHVLPIETFDSGATPKAGEKRIEPKKSADVDLEALKRQMTATIERAKADDPRELRKRIAELERALKAKPAAAAPPAPKRVEVPVLNKTDRRTIAAATERLERAVAVLQSVIQGQGPGLAKAAADLRAALAPPAPGFRTALSDVLAGRPAYQIHAGAVTRPVHANAEAVLPKSQIAKDRFPAPQRRAEPGPAGGRPALSSNGSVAPARQRILDALSFLEGIGVGTADKTQLALMSDARPTSGAYFNNLGALRSGGFIDYPMPGAVSLTEQGRSQANPQTAPQTPGELHERLKGTLPPAKWKILKVLIDVYPKSITKDDLAPLADARHTSGAYFNNLGSLRSLGVVVYPRPGEVAAAPVLFLEGGRS